MAGLTHSSNGDCSSCWLFSSMFSSSMQW